jgi:hypothetical protein
MPSQSFQNSQTLGQFFYPLYIAMYRYTVPVVCGYSTGFRGICSFSFSSHLITIKTVCMSAWQMVHYWRETLGRAPEKSMGRSHVCKQYMRIT